MMLCDDMTDDKTDSIKDSPIVGGGGFLRICDNAELRACGSGGGFQKQRFCGGHGCMMQCRTRTCCTQVQYSNLLLHLLVISEEEVLYCTYKGKHTYISFIRYIAAS
jgi:hypothetical protein